MDYPKSLPGIGLAGGKFADANPTTGAPGSWISAAWANSLMDELLGVISGAGLTPSEADNDQTLKAVKALIVAAFTGSNQSLASVGYQKLPGGLILQFGSSSSISGAATSVVFPVAFPSRMVVRGAFLNDTGGAAGHWCTVASVGGGGSGDELWRMSVSSWQASQTRAPNGLTFWWIALGY